MWIAVVGVISGFILWSLLWIGGNRLFGAMMPEQFQLDKAQSPEVGALLGLIILSVVCSLAAGALARRIGGGKLLPVWILGGLLLAVGVAVEAEYWHQLPLWYHLTFLILLGPMTFAGARLQKALSGNHPQTEE